MKRSWRRIYRSRNIPFRAEAIQKMKDADEPYKVELIGDLPEDAVLSFLRQGDFTDLCAGPHAVSTGKVKVPKLLRTAGAYWRGNEKTRCCTAFMEPRSRPYRSLTHI